MMTTSELSIGALLRSLRRNALFATSVVVILGLTAAATLAMVALLDGVLFSALPFPESDRLVSLCERHERLGDWCGIATPTSSELARRSRTLDAAGVGRSWVFTLEVDGEPRTVGGGLLGPGFLEALGVGPQIGRYPTASEMGEDDGRVVVLSNGLWRSAFGRDVDVLGRSVLVGDTPHTVIGVLPEGFAVPDIPDAELWRPLHFHPEDVDRRDWRGFIGIARLADGVDLDAARAELAGLYGDLEAVFAEIDDTWRFDAIPLLDRVVGSVRSQLWLFGAAVALFALIGAANVVNLFFFRALRSRKDDAIRSALGARSTERLARAAAEGGLIAAAATALGVLAGTGVLRILLRMAPPEVPRLDLVQVGATPVVAAALLIATISVGAALLAALLSAVPGIGEGLRGARSRWTSHVRAVLVFAETGLSLTLLAAAALLGRSFWEFTRWDPGFDTEGIAAVQLFASTAEVTDAEQAAQAWRETERFAVAVPGVLAAATVSAGPLFGGTETEVYATDAGATGPLPSVRRYDASPGYFETLGRPLTVGRDLAEADIRGADLVAVVNETLAARAWPDLDPIGRDILLPELDLTFTVVGVVRDIEPLVPGQPPEAELFWSNRQLPRWGSFLIVRLGPGTTVRQVEAALEAMEPRISVGALRPLAERHAAALVRPRFLLFLIGVFAVLAALLAAGGLFAVLSVSVAERMRELGIRMALGATRSRVVRHVLWSGLRLAAVGAGAGVLLHLSTEGALLAMVPGLAPAGAGLLLIAVGVLLAATLLASLPPAVRAGRADPLSLLRET